MPASSDNGRDSVDSSSKSQRNSLTRRQRRQQQKKMEKSKPKNSQLDSKSEKTEKPGAKSQNSMRPRLNLNAIVPTTPTGRASAVGKTNGQIQRYTPARIQPERRLRQVNLEIANSQADDSTTQIGNLRTPPPSVLPSTNINTRNRRQERKQPQQPIKRVASVLPISGAKLEAVDNKKSRKGNRQSSTSDKRTISLPLQTKSKQPPARLRPLSPFIYGARLLILGIGLGALVGSALSIWDPTTRIPTTNSQPGKQQTQKSVSAVSEEAVPAQASTQPPAPVLLQLNQEISAPVIKALIQENVKQNPKLFPGVFLLDLDNGAYFDWEGTTTFSAASTIKVPVLLAFFQDVDAGKIKLDEELTIQKEVIGGGSGVLQYRPIGTKLTALEVATQMIIISDNTATNMIIARLGGIEAVNQRFNSWGLKQTVVRNQLPDLEGTNTTSPKELSETMGLINQGYMVSQRSRDQMLEIMRRTKTRTLLPQGIDKAATISHKTGDIGSMVGDVGLINMPSGKRYLATVLVKRPHNNFQAKELIRKVSRQAYKYFSQPPEAASSTPTPTPSPTSTN